MTLLNRSRVRIQRIQVNPDRFILIEGNKTWINPSLSLLERKLGKHKKQIKVIRE